ncbi:MAG TPA: CBS domain-containing protein [Roseiflexaceae bacterium]|nr:CBS domain-containing protein [Roseiflexaceae bacterium]
MQVRDIMSQDVSALTPTTTIAEVAQQMRHLNVGSIPIVEDGKLVGIITDRDIVLRVVADGLDPHLEQADLHMTRDPLTITPDTSAEEAERIMARQQIRRLPIVENDSLVGYLALGDLALQNKDAKVGDTLERISQPGR